MNTQWAQDAVANPRYAHLKASSNRVVQAFLDQRAAADERKDVSGGERTLLKDLVFPYLKPKQQPKFREDYTKYDKWLTDTFRQRRPYVIQPSKTTSGFQARTLGADNGLSKASLKVKNQKPSIKASKDRFEENNPGRMNKWNGTAAKKGWSSKYRSSAKGQATAARWEEARRVQRQEEVVSNVYAEEKKDEE